MVCCDTNESILVAYSACVVTLVVQIYIYVRAHYYLATGQAIIGLQNVYNDPLFIQVWNSFVVARLSWSFVSGWP